MPDGNPPVLITSTWQPVSGARSVEIFPLVKKIDVVSSNSYLIQTNDFICLIDPGGLPEQAAQIIATIQELRNIRDRPLVVFLTHAHIDHFLCLQHSPAQFYMRNAILAVQDAGADSLERGDRFLTQADLLGVTISPMKIDLRLLKETPKEKIAATSTYSCSNGAKITIKPCENDVNSGLLSERIFFGNGPYFDVFHTPGHSPDSICFRIGRLLFIGDTLFAANPGIAGLHGWNQNALVTSLQGIQRIIASGTIDWVCPGHGRIISAADAARMFTTICNDAQELGSIAELNAERAARAAAFAEDCMEQVNELFTIMAGRLYYVSYVMDELGESVMAEEMASLIHGDVIEELLDAFREFSAEHHKTNQVSIFLALKAAQVIGKLERSFKKEALEHIIDPTLVSRASRLLSDYTTLMRGFSPPCEISAVGIDALIEKRIADHVVHSCSDDDCFLSVDDDAAFAQMLLSRIGMKPLLADISVRITMGCGKNCALIDPDHFADLITYLLEDLVGGGSDQITIDTTSDGEIMTITLSGNTDRILNNEEKATPVFLQRLAERAGGLLAVEASGRSQKFIITVKRELSFE